MPIEDLVGEELNSVSFVMDYVEFGFNGPVLRVMTNVEVSKDGQKATFPHGGSRDALARAIGTSVQRISIEPSTEMRISLSDGSVLRIPLVCDESTGPEAVHFVPDDGETMSIW